MRTFVSYMGKIKVQMAESSRNYPNLSTIQIKKCTFVKVRYIQSQQIKTIE